MGRTYQRDGIGRFASARGTTARGSSGSGKAATTAKPRARKRTKVTAGGSGGYDATGRREQARAENLQAKSQRMAKLLRKK